MPQVGDLAARKALYVQRDFWYDNSDSNYMLEIESNSFVMMM
jgi:hypothetical protein